MASASDLSNPYVLDEDADDALGHRVRYLFRQNAASKRDQNGIYYYLKELLAKHGVLCKKTNEKLLYEAEFKVMVANIPTLQTALSEKEVLVLFHKIDIHTNAALEMEELLQFCLLNYSQLHALLIKYWKYLKDLHMSSAEVHATFNRMVRKGEAAISLELFNSMIFREFDISLTTNETLIIMKSMDSDEDGNISVNDFESFHNRTLDMFDNFTNNKKLGITDVQVSLNESEEKNYKKQGYMQISKNVVHGATAKPIYIWYKRGDSNNTKPAIAKVQLSRSAKDTTLVSLGFSCIDKDINRSGNIIGKHQYIWIQSSTSIRHSDEEIVDIALTCGETKDKSSAILWIPPCRGFRRILGNLNEKSSKHDTFLWVRARSARAKPDELPTSKTVRPCLAKNAVEVQSSSEELESQVRNQLRRKCPLDNSGYLNLKKLFEEFDEKRSGAINKQMMKRGLESLGVNMKTKDFAFFWDKVDVNGVKKVEYDNFIRFLELTDAGIDEIVVFIQRNMVVGLNKGVDYREIFQKYNSANDGKLSLVDFQQLLCTLQQNVTEEELLRIIKRFDMNNDGIVDYADFLRFITGVCDVSAREARRVENAAEELREWAVLNQNRKAAIEGNIDSTSSWKKLKSKKDGSVNALQIDRVIRQLGLRLTSVELRKLCVLVSPSHNGKIDKLSFHGFVNHKPKKIDYLKKIVKQIIEDESNSDNDNKIFNTLNVGGNGRILLPTLVKILNEVAQKKSRDVIDIKDLVYLVQHTGADVGSDGEIFIDRFLANVHGDLERRNMKHEFITRHDSKDFQNGVQALRKEIKQCAKKLDGTFDYRIPFRLFDKDSSDAIILSEFEHMIKDLGIGDLMSEKEVMALMRRFDPNSSGGIDYDEFLRFVCDDSNLSISTFNKDKSKEDLNSCSIKSVFFSLYDQSNSILKFSCSKMQNLFIKIDRDNLQKVSICNFFQILEVLGFQVSSTEKKDIIEYLKTENDDQLNYPLFCKLFSQVEGSYESSKQDGILTQSEDPKYKKLLEKFRQGIEAVSEERSRDFDLVSIFKLFDVDKNGSISINEFSQILELAGVENLITKKELKEVIDHFELGDEDSINFEQFCSLVQNANVHVDADTIVKNNSDVPQSHIDSLIIHLQEQLNALVKDKSKIGEFHEVFSKLDLDHNGSLSTDEFQKFLIESKLSDGINEDECKSIVNFFDTNHDGNIDFKEFLSIAQHAGEMLSKEIMKISINNESNAVGKLCIEKIIQYCVNMNKKLSKKFTFQAKFSRYDLSGNGEISTDKFVKILNSFFLKLNNISGKNKIFEKSNDIASFYKVKNKDNRVNYSDFCNRLRDKEKELEDEEKTLEDESYSDSSDDDSDNVDSGDDENYLVIMIKRVLSRYSSDDSCHNMINFVEEKRRKLPSSGLMQEKKFRRWILSIGLEFSNKELKDLIKFLTDKSMQVDFQRFQQLIEKATVNCNQIFSRIYQCLVNAARSNIHIVKMFENCDTNRTNYVSLDEFQIILRMAGCNISKKEVLAISKSIHKGFSKQINYRIFMKVLHKSISQIPQHPMQTNAGYTVPPYRKLPEDSNNSFQPISPTPVFQYPPNVVNQNSTSYPLHSTTVQGGNPYNNQISPGVFSPNMQYGPATLNRSAHSHNNPIQLQPVVINIEKSIEAVRQKISQRILSLQDQAVDIISFFMIYDLQKTGTISLSEFQEALRQLNFPILESEITILHQYFADASNHNLISYSKFLEHMNCIPARLSSLNPLRIGNAETIKSPVSPTTVESWLKNNATPEEKNSFNRIFSSINKYKEGNSFDSNSVNYGELKAKSQEIRESYPVQTKMMTGWKCPICYHTQENKNATRCEICACSKSTNSGSTSSATSCPVCSYQNNEGANVCNMCDSDLQSRFKILDTTKSTPAQQNTMALNTSDDGWLN